MVNGTLNYIETVDSTNSYLLAYPKELSNGTALYTLNQTKGRGRLGRAWEDKQGKGIALSVVYSLPIEKLAPLPLIAGIGVAQALEERHSLKVGLKWSNDVVVNGKKLSGILCDSKISQNKNKAVVGIGINITQTSQDFENLPFATSLKILGINETEPELLAKIVLLKLNGLVAQYLETGLIGSLLDDYKDKSVTLGKEIIAIKDGESRRGTAIDISPEGGLVCQFPQGAETLYSGEVSVRGIYGYA